MRDWNFSDPNNCAKDQFPSSSGHKFTGSLLRFRDALVSGISGTGRIHPSREE
jgi:hypothetical protein